MSKTTINENETAFNLKGAAFTIPVLSLRDRNLDKVSAQLMRKVGLAPDFFRSAPIVISLQHLPDGDQLDLALLIDLVRGQGFIPVGITGGTERQCEKAVSMELAVLTSRSGGKKLEDESVEDNSDIGDNDTSEEKKAKTETVVDIPQIDRIDKVEPEPKPTEIQAPSFMITEPVRSGQRVAADQGDLIVMAAVSSGAEILTPGSIHAYGALRGRAFAGSDGDENACIFCQRLEAELVSVAGVYLVNENFPTALRSTPVQIQLRAGQLHISAL
jgi:septum site-determining protein MinC